MLSLNGLKDFDLTTFLQLYCAGGNIYNKNSHGEANFTFWDSVYHISWDFLGSVLLHAIMVAAVT